MAVELRKSFDVHAQLERDIKAHKETDAEKMRRESILGLSQDLLVQLNPQLSSERVEEIFFSSGDVLAKPLTEFTSEVEEQNAPMTTELIGWKDALNIAHFYHDNNDLHVPGKVRFAHSKRSAKKSQKSGEKELLYLQLGSAQRDEIQFGNEAGEFYDVYLLGVKQKVPRKVTRGVLIALALPSFGGSIASWEDATRDKKEISIIGVDNIILAGAIENPKGKGTDIYLQAEKNIAIMPDAKLTGAKTFSFQVSGDIQQYGGVVEANSVKGHNYVQMGGEIKRPGNLGPGSFTEVNLTGEYRHIGGEHPEPMHVKIVDAHHQKVIERDIQIFVAREGIEHDDVQKPEIAPKDSGLTEEALQKHFERTYTPDKVVKRIEKDGSRTKIQTHLVGDYTHYVAFINDTIAAGWVIEDKLISNGQYGFGYAYVRSVSELIQNLKKINLLRLMML